MTVRLHLLAYLPAKGMTNMGSALQISFAQMQISICGLLNT